MKYIFKDGLVWNDSKNRPLTLHDNGKRISIRKKDGTFAWTTKIHFCLTNFYDLYTEWKIAQLKKLYKLNFDICNYKNYLISDSEDDNMFLYSLISNKFIKPVTTKRGIIKYQVSENGNHKFELKENFI